MGHSMNPQLGNDNVHYENYRDTAIPKRMKLLITEGIDLITIDESKYLQKFLENVSERAELKI
jgi:hypothetical protein